MSIWRDVVFPTALASQAASSLRATAEMIDRVGEQRESLADHARVHWTGGHHEAFEEAFTPLQAEAGELAVAMRATASDLDGMIAEVEAENRRRAAAREEARRQAEEEARRRAEQAASTGAGTGGGPAYR